MYNDLADVIFKSPINEYKSALTFVEDYVKDPSAFLQSPEYSLIAEAIEKAMAFDIINKKKELSLTLIAIFDYESYCKHLLTNYCKAPDELQQCNLYLSETEFTILKRNLNR